MKYRKETWYRYKTRKLTGSVILGWNGKFCGGYWIQRDRRRLTNYAGRHGAAGSHGYVGARQ